jgi:hypothetical protein
VLRSLVFDHNFRQGAMGGKSALPLLTTMILGWGALVLSSLPDKAVLHASQAALKVSCLKYHLLKYLKKMQIFTRAAVYSPNITQLLQRQKPFFTPVRRLSRYTDFRRWP